MNSEVWKCLENVLIEPNEKHKLLLDELFAQVKLFHESNQNLSDLIQQNAVLLEKQTELECTKATEEYFNVVDISPEPILCYHDFGARIRFSRQTLIEQNAREANRIAEMLKLSNSNDIAKDYDRKEYIDVLKNVYQSHKKFQEILNLFEKQLKPGKQIPVI